MKRSGGVSLAVHTHVRRVDARALAASARVAIGHERERRFLPSTPRASNGCRMPMTLKIHLSALAALTTAATIVLHAGALRRVAQAPATPAAPRAAEPQQAGGPSGFSANSALKFRPQEIAADFGVGYAVVSGDVNGDGRSDILAISGTELVWFEAPTWKKSVILGAGPPTTSPWRRTMSTATDGSMWRWAPGGRGRTPARCSG
jgi:hypothetical protein